MSWAAVAAEVAKRAYAAEKQESDEFEAIMARIRPMFDPANQQPVPPAGVEPLAWIYQPHPDFPAIDRWQYVVNAVDGGAQGKIPLNLGELARLYHPEQGRPGWKASDLALSWNLWDAQSPAFKAPYEAGVDPLSGAARPPSVVRAEGGTPPVLPVGTQLLMPDWAIFRAQQLGAVPMQPPASEAGGASGGTQGSGKPKSSMVGPVLFVLALGAAGTALYFAARDVKKAASR